MSMSLWGCGFNAFGQLTYGPPDSEEQRLEQEDLRIWTQILTAEYTDFIYGDFSANLVSIQTPSSIAPRLHYLGIPSLPQTSFIDHLYTILNSPQPIIQNKNQIATLSSGRLALVSASSPRTITIYKNIHSHLSQTLESSFDFPSEITTIVGNLGAFHVLTKEELVYSWGDARFPQLLGREVTDGTPADTPSEITELSSLPTGPIQKLISSGTVTAALTLGKDLYIWGTSSNSSSSSFLPFFQPSDPEEEEEAVKSIDIHGLDVIDIAVGRDYMIAITIDGEERRVWGIGSNGNGQLGLGDVDGVGEWVEMKVPVCGKVEGVWTGYDNSFLVVRDT